MPDQGLFEIAPFREEALRTRRELALQVQQWLGGIHDTRTLAQVRADYLAQFGATDTHAALSVDEMDRSFFAQLAILSPQNSWEDRRLQLQNLLINTNVGDMAAQIKTGLESGMIFFGVMDNPKNDGGLPMTGFVDVDEGLALHLSVPTGFNQSHIEESSSYETSLTLTNLYRRIMTFANSEGKYYPVLRYPDPEKMITLDYYGSPLLLGAFPELDQS